MRLRIIVLLVLSLFLANEVIAKDPSWLKKMREIRLLVDKYEDVIRILGTPGDKTVERELSEYFDFPEGRLWVGFATGQCVVTPYSEGKPIGWLVPPYTVIDISFSPDRWIEPKNLGIKNFNGFTAMPIHEGREGIEYVNDELGVDYTVNRGKIQDITFRPAKKYDYLLCK